MEHLILGQLVLLTIAVTFLAFAVLTLSKRVEPQAAQPQAQPPAPSPELSAAARAIVRSHLADRLGPGRERLRAFGEAHAARRAKREAAK